MYDMGLSAIFFYLTWRETVRPISIKSGGLGTGAVLVRLI